MIFELYRSHMKAKAIPPRPSEARERLLVEGLVVWKVGFLMGLLVEGLVGWTINQHSINNSLRFAHPHQPIVKQRVVFKLRCAVWLDLAVFFLKNRRTAGLWLDKDKMPADSSKTYTCICTCDRQRQGQTSQTECPRFVFQKPTKCQPILTWHTK